jgi:hypothetical protein
MDEPAQLQHAEHWRMAVWGLRVGYVGLAVALVGLIVMLSGSTAWILAVGVIIWLAAAIVYIDRVHLGSARAPRAETRVLVDAVHAPPRKRPLPAVGPAVVTGARVAARVHVCCIVRTDPAIRAAVRVQ